MRTGAGGQRLLDAGGREQAEALRRTLPVFGPSRLLAAGEARFVDTMRPLGAELGVAVEIEPTFGEEKYAERPRHGLTRILELAAAGGSTAVCATGAVSRHLLATLAADAGLDVREYPAVKGSVWALFFSGGRLAAADYYPSLGRKVVLLRHAKSAWPDVPDHDRPLARRGRRDAPVMGRWLRATGHLPDQVVCSTARRARETWQLAQAGLEATPPVSSDAWTLLIVGHDPAVPELAPGSARLTWFVTPRDLGPSAKRGSDPDTA